MFDGGTRTLRYPQNRRISCPSGTGILWIRLREIRLFKQAARLTRQKDALVELISEMNALNAKAKSKEIAELLDEYVPGVEELMTKLKKTSTAAKEMVKDAPHISQAA